MGWRVHRTFRWSLGAPQHCRGRRLKCRSAVSRIAMIKRRMLVPPSQASPLFIHLSLQASSYAFVSCVGEVLIVCWSWSRDDCCAEVGPSARIDFFDDFVPFGVQSKNQSTQANFSSLEALNKEVNGGDA